MGFFNKKKKEKFVDLGARYQKQHESIPQAEYAPVVQKEEEERPATSPLGFLGTFYNNTPSETSTQENSTSFSEEADRKKKFAKRFLEMTNKMEDLSNQVYHLQQRIELLEKKLDVNKFS